MHIIHELLHQENAQPTYGTLIYIRIQIRRRNIGGIKRIPMIPKDNSQAGFVRFAGAFNLSPIFFLISMFNNVGTGFINSQLYGIAFGIIHAGIVSRLGSEPTNGIQLIKSGRKN